MALTPLHDRVLVEPKAPEETTAGGIIIPDTVKEKPQEGKIKAVGGGKITEDGKVLPLNVKVGDLVLFSKYGGTEVSVEGKDMLIMRESDIYAIIG